MVREAHDHADVMLNQYDRRPEGLIDVAYETAELDLFVRIHSRHGLVEQQEFWRRHQARANSTRFWSP